MATLTDLEASQWKGKAELWLDPAGNDVAWSDCALRVVGGTLTYTWSFEGEEHAGSLTQKGEVVEFQDSFHASTPMECATIRAAWSLLEAFGTYAAGEGPRWGWRLSVSLRPTDELVLQMTNVCPWGEDARAVRMVATRV